VAQNLNSTVFTQTQRENGSGGELNGEWHDHQKVAGVIDPNSGGNTVYLAPGLRATYDRFSSFALVGVPIANHMNGLQSKPDYKVLFGMAVAF
jgi:hypothetical protein